VDGTYALLRELGSGACGTVWEAEHLVVEKRVALKPLRPELASDRRLRRRFVADAPAAAKIAHANGVDIYDLGVSSARRSTRHSPALAPALRSPGWPV
jgi:serine/threonine-protein kinase